MIRAIFGETLLFFLPFLVFALFLILKRRNPFRLAAWSDATVWLVVAGLACVIVALVITGITADRETGGFEPPHLENGRVVPGQFR
jgi:Family of unknown function (DUF6111)